MKKFFRIALVISLVCIVAAGGYHFLRPATGADIPSVFVHGYSGWGEYDEKYKSIPYWGLTQAEDVKKMFDRWGQDVYMPSVGPHSSAWDRACEVYAEITGTRVDYGEAHSKKCGHERFGRDYSGRALIPDFTWDNEHPVNLVGHSFGGTTARVLLDLLADGSSEEIAATGEDTSPLFKGGNTGMVFSLSIIASPSNGADFLNIPAKEEDDSSISRQSAGYDAYLDQFGIESDENTTEQSATEAMDKVGFYEHCDSAVNDMLVDRACAMNSGIELQPNVYYFCYYGCRTSKDASGASVPTDKMSRYLKGRAIAIGGFSGQTPGSYSVGYGDAKETFTVPKQSLDEEWQPNDGLVNVVSAYCPYHLDASGNRVYDEHTEYSGTGAAQPGVWNILPEFDQDHYGFIGGIYSEDIRDVRQIYKDMHERMDALRLPSS